jgi:penicillin-binding protein 1A
MKVAVARRPVEKFDTEMTLPAWQLEPDDEALMSGGPEDYYYVDEQGNLIDPNRPRSGEDPEAPPLQRDGGQEPVVLPPAANDDFLNEATGRNRPQG